MSSTASGWRADPAPTQVVSRDRHAELLTTLAILGGTLERIAVELRHLQRTEVGEAFEPFGSGQQGTSAMPHKRNPILTERVTGMARLLRADALVGLENMALWHERDISHSSAERFVFERAIGVAALRHPNAWPTSSTGSRSTPIGCGANLDLPGRDGLLGGAAAGDDREGRRPPGGLPRSSRGRPSGVARREPLSGTRSAPIPGSPSGSTPTRSTRAMDLEPHLAGIEATYRALGLADAGWDDRCTAG